MATASAGLRFSQFLTARWSNLAILSYAVPDEMLLPLLPPDCELDKLGGRAFVSLVAFDFLNTRVMGISWPGMRNFPEVNLRFYVRHRGRRGVTFIREFVPSAVVARTAKFFYNEPYLGIPMTSRVTETDKSVSVRHELTVAGRAHSLAVRGGKPAFRAAEDSTEHFFKEHEWGYGTSRSGKLISFRVEHEAWDTYPVESHELNLDWAAVYGERWRPLNMRNPDHILLAVGSHVRVFRSEKTTAYGWGIGK